MAVLKGPSSSNTHRAPVMSQRFSQALAAGQGVLHC